MKNIDRLWGSIVLFSIAGIVGGLLISFILFSVAIPKYSLIYMSQEMYSLMVIESVEYILSLKDSMEYASIFYILLMFIATRMIFSKIELFNRDNIKINLLILVIFILIGLSVYLFTMPIDKLPMAISLFIILFTIFYISNKIDKNEILYSELLVYTIFSTIVILFFGLHLINIISNSISSMEILSNTSEAVKSGFIKLTFIIVGVAFLMHIFIASVIITSIKNLKRFNILATLLILFVVIVNYSFQTYLENHDMNRASLNQVANLTILKERPKPHRVLILDKQQHIEEVKIRVPNHSLFNRVSTQPQEIDLIADNIPKLEEYIYGRDFRYFTSSAMETLLQISIRMWDIEKFREVSFELIENRGDVLYSMVLLHSLQMLPINETNRQFLEKLSDKSRFYISSDAAYTLSKAWISFGDEERAKEFYDMSTQNDSWDKLLEKYRFNSGKISGLINNLPYKSKLALIESSNYISFVRGLDSIKDIILTKDKFSFSNLVEGNYTLALILENSDINISDIIGTRSFVISKETPIYSDINITIISEPTL